MQEGEDTAYAQLSAAAASFRSLAVQLSHRLSNDERLRIVQQISDIFSILLNSRWHFYDNFFNIVQCIVWRLQDFLVIVAIVCGD